AQEGRDNTKEILRSIYQMVSRIDHWYRWARDIAEKDLADNPLRLTLQSIIQTDLSQYLGSNIDDILKQLPQASGSESWSSYWSRREFHLHDLWRTSQSGALSFTPMARSKPVDRLLEILQGVHHANNKLREVAGQYLEEMLTSRSDHPPQTVLYIAFARLLELLRGKLNTMAGRHLDFYYRNVLALAESGSSADVGHLSFAAAPHVNGPPVPAGTRLAAGKDSNGKALEYATDADLFVNRARIDSIKAQYLARDRFATSPHAPHRVTSILALPNSDSQDGLG